MTKGYAHGGCVLQVLEHLRKLGWKEEVINGRTYLTHYFHGQKVYIYCPSTTEDIAVSIHLAAQKVVELGGVYKEVEK